MLQNTVIKKISHKVLGTLKEEYIISSFFKVLFSVIAGNLNMYMQYMRNSSLLSLTLIFIK